MKKVISILLAIAMLSCFMVTVVSASNGTGTATVKVANVTVEKGQNATVSVSVANNPGYRSYAMALKYDSSKLEVVSVSSNVTSNTNNAGVVYVSFASATLVEGDGQMFSVTFKTKHDCKASAAVKVEVEELFTKGANNAAQKIPFTTSNGSVTVKHVAKTVAGKAATCTEDGLTDGSVCSVCGETLKAQEKIAAKGHKYTTKVTAATCTEGGYTTYTCSVCGDTYVGDKTEAKGHTLVTKAAVAATCTETGLTEGKYCSVCGYVEVEQKVIPALGHVEVVDAGKAATCTEDGLTEGKHCSVCGTVTVAQEVIKATGHDFSAEYKYDDEQHWHVCSKCGALSTKENHVHNIKVDDKLYCECGHFILAPTEPTQPDVTDPSTPAPGDDDEPETGDITGLIVFGSVALIAVVAAAAYTFKRKFAK